VIHPSSVAVSREHRRAKTGRLDTELLKRGFLGWLRGERGHCSMARVPTIAEEDSKRPNRERKCLVGERTRIVNRMKATLARPHHTTYSGWYSKCNVANQRADWLMATNGAPDKRAVRQQ